MATLIRNPLSTRPLTNQISTPASSLHLMARKSSSTKRARSPEAGDSNSAKRSRAAGDTLRPTTSVRDEVKRRDGKEPREERERRRAEREEEFRIKYTRAFPNWVFYFDLDIGDTETATTRKELERMVSHMNAVRAHINITMVHTSSSTRSVSMISSPKMLPISLSWSSMKP